MQRLYLLAAGASAALALSGPVFAQDGKAAEQEVTEEEIFEFMTEDEEELERVKDELAASFGIFGALFATDPLTPEQEERLPQARAITDVVFPEGTFGTVMNETIAPMMNTMMSLETSDPRTGLSALTGIEYDELTDLDDETAQSALDVLDPQFSQRNDRIGEVVSGMTGDLLNAIEPAYREAMARAYAIRFDEGELDELLMFLATPLGEKFGRESILVQYDPQMMQVMEGMGPALGEMLPGMMEKFAAISEDFPAARTFPELSSAEQGRLAQLLGKGEAELQALAPEFDVEEEDDDEEAYY